MWKLNENDGSEVNESQVTESNQNVYKTTKQTNEAENEAKLRELENWRDFNVYDEVQNTGQKTISTRWVVTSKENNKVKARLVVRGFEDEDENNEFTNEIDNIQQGQRLLNEAIGPFSTD